MLSFQLSSGSILVSSTIGEKESCLGVAKSHLVDLHMSKKIPNLGKNTFISTVLQLVFKVMTFGVDT